MKLHAKIRHEVLVFPQKIWFCISTIAKSLLLIHGEEKYDSHTTIYCKLEKYLCQWHYWKKVLKRIDMLPFNWKPLWLAKMKFLTPYVQGRNKHYVGHWHSKQSRNHSSESGSPKLSILRLMWCCFIRFWSPSTTWHALERKAGTSSLPSTSCACMSFIFASWTSYSWRLFLLIWMLLRARCLSWCWAKSYFLTASTTKKML